MNTAPHLRLIASILLAAMSSLAIAACGGGGGNAAATTDPNKLLSQTFGPSQSTHSGQLALALDINLQGTKTLSGPIAIKLNGPFQGHGKSSLPDLKFTLQLGSATQSFAAGVTSTAGKAWVQFAGQDYLVPDSVFAQFRSSYLKSSTTSSSSSSLSRFGIDPRSWLTNARTVGHEQVAGTDTIHVAAGVNVAKLLADFNTLLGKTAGTTAGAVPAAPRGISPATQAALVSATRSAAVDIYSGSSDHALRRLKVALQLSPSSAQRTQLHGLQGGSVSFDLQISDLNNHQDIAAPKNAKPLAGLLSGGLGGTGAAAGSGGSAAGAGATPPAGSGSVAAPSAYLTCVSKAGGDVSAIQRCQSLVNGGK